LLAEKQRNTNIEVEYMQLFESYDQNRVGYLPVEQILIVMNALKELDVFHNPDYTSENVQSWLKMVNRDDDGSVKYIDWIKLLRVKNILK
jgi:Ca2+-binding EF-hand superfamily protein